MRDGIINLHASVEGVGDNKRLHFKTTALPIDVRKTTFRKVVCISVITAGQFRKDTYINLQM